ncbi:hypothetical protein [Lyngbya aestuarii]|uniref:hypothetical protein n=1 Tax=Lyngbya aestuarii TaxID=118322 RepID=UPI00403D94F4
MPKFCLRLPSAVAVALLTFATSCSRLPSLSNITVGKTSSSATKNATRLVSSEKTSPDCSQIDPFTKAVGKAISAATLAQSAASEKDWDLVVSRWIAAIDGMQAVPPESPKRIFAQKKVVEYLQNLDIAQRKASSINYQLPFSSFDNEILDEQLLLYLSYVAAVGPPDVLIVGSSRALQGVDPQQLQQVLASFGKEGLKVFNFGVNGATAQFVDFQLRQLLSAEQLPRLILWADGVRAFNSGRVDKTYNSLITSKGYQNLIAGKEPTLPESEPETADACEVIETTISQASHEESSSLVNQENSTITSSNWRLTKVSYEASDSPVSPPAERLLLTQLKTSEPPQRLTMLRNVTGYSSFAVDANGFLPIDSRFEPQTYFQKNPLVPGLYDADYQPFSIAGKQAVALNSIKAFTKGKKIPLVMVNLPVTQGYLDAVRQKREQQFQQSMEQKVDQGFVFIDLAKQWRTKNEYFADPSHLNRYGAAAVSSQLAAESKIPWPVEPAKTPDGHNNPIPRRKVEQEQSEFDIRSR